MGFASRIGQFLTTAAHRIGQISVHNTLDRIGQFASVAHKVGSLINASTGNGLTMASQALLGKQATSAIGTGAGYLSRMYDGALMTKAVMSHGTGAAMSPTVPGSSNTIWTGGKRAP